MQIQYWPNKITSERKEIILDKKITTLIWENWSGKSAILEKILENHFDETNTTVISYSSWLNESFSNILKKKIDIFNRKLTSDNVPEDLSWFYFSSKWSDILVYFAYILEDWKTKNFIDNHIFLAWKEIMLKFSVTSNTYKNLILEAKKLKELWTYSLIDSTFHSQLKFFLETSIKNWLKNIDFTKNLNIKDDILNNESIKKLFKIKEEKEDYITWDIIKITNNEWKIIRNHELLSFLWLLSTYFLKIDDSEIKFSGNNLNDLSDWEFQLLVIYALIDLFDSKETIFLFDEVDSHLHYKNINKLWDMLSSIEWKLITTTHIPDSIINNEIKHIKVVKNWIIDIDNTANSIIKRLANISDHQVYSKKVASNIENIVLIDDCTDWEIFKMLTKQKLWLKEDKNQILSNIIPIKCHSWYNNSDENKQFWKEKIQWLKDFDSIILKEDDNQPRDWRVKNYIKTKNIILLCDKDDYEVYDILKKDTTKNKDKIQIREYLKIPPVILKWINVFYLSFLRREIENYFISPTLFKNIDNSLLLEINNKLWSDDALIDLTPNDNSSVRNKDFKEIISKNITSVDWKWKDYTVIENEFISKIPPDEISEDIENLYNFLIDKIK